MFAHFGWTETDPTHLDAVVVAYDATIVPRCPTSMGSAERLRVSTDRTVVSW